jgi:hypothetical protein
MDLGQEGVGRGEALFGSEEVEGLKFQGLAIEVALEIEEVGFGPGFRESLGDGGTGTQVEGGGEGTAVGEEGAAGIDATGRQDQAGDVEIGGRDAPLTSEALAGLDQTGKGVGSAEEVGGLGEGTGGDAIAHARTADGSVVVEQGRDAVDGETMVGTEASEAVEVAGALVSEDEAGADGDAGDPTETKDQTFDEPVGGLTAEGEIEGEDEGRGDAERLEGVESAPERIEEIRGVGGGDDGFRMGMKRDGDAGGLVRAGVLEHMLNHGGMAEVDAVEDAEGEADGLVGVALRCGLGEDVHAGEWGLGPGYWSWVRGRIRGIRLAGDSWSN